MFSQKTIDFLAENRLRDSKEWFDEHKNDYKKHVADPLTELVETLAPFMLEIDSEIDCVPKKCISRIHRDTRFSKDKSRYRDIVWCVFQQDKKLFPGYPGFFAEISPTGYRYGCGYCMADTSSMESIRKMILAGDPMFEKALAAYEEQDTFTIEGETYKRARFSGHPERLRDWLERRNINFIRNLKEFDTLFSDSFAAMIANDFKLLAPMYLFMLSAEKVK